MGAQNRFWWENKQTNIWINHCLVFFHTLWNKSLCSSSENMAFAALQLDTSLLGKRSPIMYLKDKNTQLLTYIYIYIYLELQFMLTISTVCTNLMENRCVVGKQKNPLLVVVGKQLCRTSVCSADPASCALAWGCGRVFLYKWVEIH